MGRGRCPCCRLSSAQVADWTCPLRHPNLAAAQMALAKRAGTLAAELDEFKLSAIEDAAIEPLTKLVRSRNGRHNQCSCASLAQTRSSRCCSTPRLRATARTSTRAWWRLRMEVLRVMHRPMNLNWWHWTTGSSAGSMRRPGKIPRGFRTPNDARDGRITRRAAPAGVLRPTGGTG